MTGKVSLYLQQRSLVRHEPVTVQFMVRALATQIPYQILFVTVIGICDIRQYFIIVLTSIIDTLLSCAGW